VELILVAIDGQFLGAYGKIKISAIGLLAAPQARCASKSFLKMEVFPGQKENVGNEAQ
jgi:hypothetical protein